MTTQKRNQNIDYTTIADRLRTVSFRNDSHQTDVVKPVYGIKKLGLLVSIKEHNLCKSQIERDQMYGRFSVDMPYPLQIINEKLSEFWTKNQIWSQGLVR